MKVNNKFLVFVFLCLAWWFPAGPAQGQGFGVGNYQVLSSTRVGRTEFEYTLSVTISNQVATAFGVTAQVYSVSTNTEVLQGEVSFGDVLLGATAVSSNTITIRQNRVAPSAGIRPKGRRSATGSSSPGCWGRTSRARCSGSR